MPTIQHNYDKSKRGSGYDRRTSGVKPSSMIIHTTNGNYGSSFRGECQYLYESNKKSTHYIVGKQGQIEELLHPIWRAWHAGATIDGYSNNQSIGIECHMTQGEAWTNAMREALTWLVRRLMTDYGIPTSRIDTHRRVALPIGRKTDPVHWSDAAFYQWRDALAPQPILAGDVVVIGTSQRATKAQIIGSLQRNRVALSLVEMERFFDLCVWLDVRADFVVALMKHETDFGRAGVALAQQSHNVGAVKTSADDWRPKVRYNGTWWYSYQSIQLALFDLVSRILKNNYGAAGKTTVRAIISEYAPPFENETQRYINAVLEDMEWICTH